MKDAKVEHVYVEMGKAKHMVEVWRHKTMCGKPITPQDIRRPITGLVLCDTCLQNWGAWYEAQEGGV